MKKHNAAVEQRVKKLLEQVPDDEAVEGVQPLNPGYFTIERFRMQARPKQRDDFRAKINGRGGE